MDENIVKSNRIEKNREETVSLKHYNRLIAELRCPGCAYPMNAPIFQCITGHSICELCTKILAFCPLCEKSFSNMRSLTIEALTAKAYFTCSNRNKGCKVRLPIRLLDWHEQQCVYKAIKCFMGKVWGECDYFCREIDWKEHVENQHMDKVFNVVPIELTWNLKTRAIPLAAFYVLQFCDEMFYLYQIYNQSGLRVMWTVTCISRKQEVISKFAFEIEIYSPKNASKKLCQRFPCHSENDKDILQEGTCVSIALGDILRFTNTEKILFYKVSIIEVDVPKIQFSQHKQSLKQDVKIFPKNFQLTSIEGVNHKKVPAEIIVTRKIPEKENSEENISIDHDSDDNDAELEKFVNHLSNSMPKLNFDKKLCNVNSTTATSKNFHQDEDDNFKGSLTKFHSVVELTMPSKKLNPIERIAKSFMNLKVDLKNLRKNKNSKNYEN